MKAVIACLVTGLSVSGAQVSQPALAHFDSEVAEAHELPPHSMNIPLKGVKEGMNPFRLTLVVSPEGKVVQAKAAAAPGYRAGAVPPGLRLFGGRVPSAEALG